MTPTTGAASEAEIDSVRDKLGVVGWHSSGEDEGPDVGLELGLGQGRSLYLGEMPKRSLKEAGVDLTRFPDAWWFVLYGENSTDVAAAVAGDEAARALFDLVAGLAEALAASQEREAALVAGLEARGIDVSGATSPVTAALVALSHYQAERDGNPLASVESVSAILPKASAPKEEEGEK